MGLERILCWGVSYRTANVSLRERLRFSLEAIADNPSLFGDEGVLGGCVLLDTCNRFEVYVHLATDGAGDKLEELWNEWTAQGLEEHRQSIYRYSGTAAAEHLGRVAAGLDSMVLGESEIVGQVREAHRQAERQGTLDPVLDRLFRGAMQVGKRARIETAISKNGASISSVAMAEAEARVGDLSDRRVLVVGAGEIGKVTVRTLRKRGVRSCREIGLINRSAPRAVELGERYHCRVWAWEQLAEALSWAEIVFSCTGASDPVISKELLETLEAEGALPCLIVDLALPRDVDAEAASAAGVEVLDLDSLQAEQAERLAGREAAVADVEAILVEELRWLEQEIERQSVEPLIVDLRKRAESIRKDELSRARRHLEPLAPEVWDQVQRLSQSLVNKILHEPTLRLREAAGQSERLVYQRAIRDLFDLDEQPPA